MGDFISYVLFKLQFCFLKFEDLYDGSFVCGTLEAWGEFHFFLIVTGTWEPDSLAELEDKVLEDPVICHPWGKEDTRKGINK